MRDLEEQTTVPARRLPALAVLVPTFNRAADLLRCLRSLSAQTDVDFEVILVDDGSTEDTAAVVERFRASAGFPITYLHQANSGPARARNVAIRLATAPICVLIGDDIFPTPGFLAAHLRHHREHPEVQEVAVGLTRWATEGQVITPFMRWLDTDGRIQFAYPQLLAGTTPGWEHFYTSNLSFKTQYLQNHPFSEDFSNAAMEDIELGYRLAQHHGLHMSFLPGALAEHRHPTTFLRCCQRALNAGAAEFLFAQHWPERAHPASRSRLKRALLPLLTERNIVLPLLRHTANLGLMLFGPHPGLFLVLLLHSKVGYRQQQQTVESASLRGIPTS